MFDVRFLLSSNGVKLLNFSRAAESYFSLMKLEWNTYNNTILMEGVSNRVDNKDANTLHESKKLTVNYQHCWAPLLVNWN